MAQQQGLWTNNVKRRAQPPHLREFLTVSASYLEVPMDSLNNDGGVWQGNTNVVKDNNQEVGYAANYA